MFAYLVEHNRYLNIIGILVITIIAIIFSKNHRAINPRVILSSLLVHILFAYLMLKTTIGVTIIEKVAHAAQTLYLFADQGIEFMFGKLSDANSAWGFVFAIKVLPVIIFIGALTGLLFHWGIIQRIVAGMNWLIRPLIGTSGVETTSAISNSILGQTEAALFMNNYIHVMTKSELFVMMCSGMAAISIPVLIIYIVLGIPGNHLLTATLLSIPASIFIAKILVPETESSLTADNPIVKFEKSTTNSFDAISKGTMDGLKLAIAVAAMLISFLSLLAMINYLLSMGGDYVNQIFDYYQMAWHIPELSLALLMSYLFAPFAYLLGFSGDKLWEAGKLLGIKVSTNELIAFTQLAKMSIAPRDFIILVYALCGFSNFSCVGIQIGMISALAPEKKHIITQLGFYAVLGSSLANLLSAMIVGLLI